MRYIALDPGFGGFKAAEVREDGEIDTAWREDGLQQMKPFRHLLAP